MNILVTGASGFIGSYIVEEGLRQGHQVWAGVRRSSSKAYLQDERIRFACLDLSSKARLPEPNTEYGRSKWKAEQWLAEQKDIPCTILRPTGVYGPREKDYFLMAQSIKQHTDFSVGFKPHEITFVYVMDVVQAVFKCIGSPQAVGRAYFLSDGQVYNSRRFSDLLQQSMGNPWVLHIKAPLWFLRIVCALSGTLSKVTGRMNALNMDKYHILSQRNWQCDIEPAKRDFGYEPQWPLERGVPAAVRWYRENGWL